MIKILQVIGTLKIGGAENVAVNLFRYIDRTKYQMDYLVYDEEDSPYVTEVEQMGGKVIRVCDLFGNRLTIEKKLYTIFLENGPYHAIHSHLMFHNGLVLSAANKANIPIRISHAHTNNDGKHSIFANSYRKIMRYKILKNATKLVACSENAGKYLYNEKICNNVAILNNRIDSLKFRYSHEKHHHYKSLFFQDDFNIIIVGHLIKLKNHKFILETFDALLKIDNRYSLTILGDGEMMSELENITNEMNCRNKVFFTGNVLNVNEYMLAADLLVMPSIYEGLPVTLIEAQASGLRCIVSDGVDKNADITGLIKFLPIDQGVNEWVHEILDSKYYKRKDTFNIIKEQHYDISDFGIWLTELYKM